MSSCLAYKLSWILGSALSMSEGVYEEQLHDRPYEVDVMEKPIDELNLTTRAEIRLIAKGCHTIGDVVAMKRDEILSTRMFGRASVQTVATELERLGITDSDWCYIIWKERKPYWMRGLSCLT